MAVRHSIWNKAFRMFLLRFYNFKARAMSLCIMYSRQPSTFILIVIILGLENYDYFLLFHAASR